MDVFSLPGVVVSNESARVVCCVDVGVIVLRVSGGLLSADHGATQVWGRAVWSESGF